MTQMSAAPTIYESATPLARHSLVASGGYAAIVHTCCICRHQWHSANKKDAGYVEKAIKTNHDGPYCILCLHLEMAARYAEARGYNAVREAMTAWKRHNDPDQRPGGKQPESL